jgi:hypothetical protein
LAALLAENWFYCIARVKGFERQRRALWFREDLGVHRTSQAGRHPTLRR